MAVPEWVVVPGWVAELERVERALVAAVVEWLAKRATVAVEVRAE